MRRVVLTGMKRSRTLLAAAALSAATLLGGASVAHGASYYTIVNQQSGLALEATVSGKVRLAPPNKSNMLQQWKRTNTQTVGPFFESSIQNRLAGCLRSDTTNFNLGFAPLKVGLCAGSATDSIKRWDHLSCAQTGSPSVPGFQLVNSQTAEYAMDFDLCFENCPPTHDAALATASVIASDPAEFGGATKWWYRFATTAP